MLAVVFFCLLSWYQYEGRGDPLLLASAFVVYLIALITDWLDGYLARKWKVEGAFGRVVDPFVDKVLVLGSFIFFAGKNFIMPQSVANIGDPHMVGHPITGVVPAMVVIDTTIRLIPGVLGDEQSAADDSHNEPGRLEFPQYTRPREYRGLAVPDVLLSGHHAAIDKWRRQQSEQRSQPDSQPPDQRQ